MEESFTWDQVYTAYLKGIDRGTNIKVEALDLINQIIYDLKGGFITAALTHSRDLRQVVDKNMQLHEILTVTKSSGPCNNKECIHHQPDDPDCFADCSIYSLVEAYKCKNFIGKSIER